MIDKILGDLIINIKNGKIVSFPTETVYALSCDANNKTAIDKIYEIKNRDKSKLCSVFIDIEDIENYVYFDNKDFVYNNLLQGNTIIFNKKDNVLPLINSATLGIRYPKHNFTRMLLKKLKMPIIATSVNISGEEPLIDYDIIKNNFKNIDHVVDNSLLKDSIINGKPSKVISIVNNKIKIIRE